MTALARLRHRGDPSTSLHAARLHWESGALARQESEVLEMVRRHPGLTFEELAEVEGSRLDKYQVARRIKALIEGGLVRAGEEKETTRGRKARSYWPAREQEALL